MADEPTDHGLALLRRLDAKLDRLQATLDEHTGRLQRLEQRSSRTEQHLGDAADGLNFDQDRVLVRLDEIERGLEDAST